MARLQRVFGMIMLGVLTSALPSMALINRTFVSAQRGSDTNPCTPTSPCRSFASAIAAASPGGEVIVLDSGGYGPFTINKAIQITSPPGVYAGVITAASDAITINAPAAAVVLRGLTIVGINPDGTNSTHAGVNVQSVGNLQIENCEFTGGTYGVLYIPAYATGVTGLFTLKNSVINRASTAGIFLGASGPGKAQVTLDHVNLEADTVGLNNALGSVARVTVRESVITGNSSYGILCSAGFFNALNGRITVDSSAVVNNVSGLGVNDVSQIYVGNSEISGNDFGLVQAGGNGQFVSYGNNRFLQGNGTDGSFTGSAPLN